jgi:hypothetical protein
MLILKGVHRMKYLKIERNKGYFSIDGAKWIQIDEITKEHLLKLVDIALKKEFEMDEYDSAKMANQSHQIIYKNIFDKLNELKLNKNRFKDESKSIYREAIAKYKESTN